MDSLEIFKTVNDDFAVEFEILSFEGSSVAADPRQEFVSHDLQMLDTKIQENLQRIEELNTGIDRLTNHADGIDYAIAVISGLATGMIDSIVVGAWDFKNAKANSNKEINEKVMAFAKKQGYEGDRLKGAIDFLEKKYPLPGDGAYQPFKSEKGINDYTHHLDDFCHHPTLIGLICCVIVQFTGSTIYCNSHSEMINLPITVNTHGKFVGNNPITKMFSGIINWFFNIAQTWSNRKGHLMSDMAGSYSSASKGNDGMGLPGSFLSTMKELSSLPCFKDKKFGENLRKAFQNGIGTRKQQLDLGILNHLFDGASSKFDMRTEIAIKNELERQALPVVINEVLVRGLYFIRKLIAELKIEQDFFNINWKTVLPLKNRTIDRMITISTGTFMAFDLMDAAIRGAIKSGMDPALFTKEFILRVNFVGVGRFAVAVFVDGKMGVQRSKLRNERIAMFNEQLHLLNAKIFYIQAGVWVAAEKTEQAINEAYEVMENSLVYLIQSLQAIDEGLNNIGQNIPKIEENNPALIDEIKDVLKWG